MSKQTKKNSPKYFDYKDVESLRRFIDPFGQIDSRAKTGLSAVSQRRLSIAIKRARHLAMLPFVAS
jgi:small subunit ribosomal protein S18